jgi:hypothetical protein
MTKKIISFSLYKAPESWETSMSTNHLKYLNGLKEILKTIDDFFSGWTVYIYHDGNFKFEDINIQSIKKNNVEFKLVNDKNLNAMQWRFLPIDEPDVELFISRDLDSRFSDREIQSINEWIESDKIVHIMRDHPHHHYEILGGMWGMKKVNEFNMCDSILEYNLKNEYIVEKDWFEKWWDMNFLRDIIYKNFHLNSYVNAEYHTLESWSKPFTLERKNNNFIGEIYSENNQRTDHYKLL